MNLVWLPNNERETVWFGTNEADKRLVLNIETKAWTVVDVKLGAANSGNRNSDIISSVVFLD